MTRSERGLLLSKGAGSGGVGGDARAIAAMDADEALEEQEMELEALESIYMEDYVLLSEEGAHPASLQLRLVPVQGGADREEGGNFVAALLKVTYTKLYPEEVPEVRVESDFGLNSAQIQELCDVARSTAEEYVGEVMVYSIAEAIVEWLQANNRPELDGSAHSEMMERSRIAKEKSDAAKAAAEQEAEAARKAESATDSGIRKRLGTMLTPELFHAWNEKFMAEMQAAEIAQKDAIMKAGGGGSRGGKNEPSEEEIMARPTGKSLFEMDVTMINSEEQMIAAAVAEEEAMLARLRGEETGTDGGDRVRNESGGESKTGTGGSAGTPPAPHTVDPGSVVMSGPIDASLFEGDDDDDLDDLDLED